MFQRPVSNPFGPCGVLCLPDWICCQQPLAVRSAAQTDFVKLHGVFQAESVDVYDVGRDIIGYDGDTPHSESSSCATPLRESSTPQQDADCEAGYVPDCEAGCVPETPPPNSRLPVHTEQALLKETPTDILKETLPSRISRTSEAVDLQCNHSPLKADEEELASNSPATPAFGDPVVSSLKSALNGRELQVSSEFEFAADGAAADSLQNTPIVVDFPASPPTDNAQSSGKPVCLENAQPLSGDEEHESAEFEIFDKLVESNALQTSESKSSKRMDGDATSARERRAIRI